MGQAHSSRNQQPSTWFADAVVSDDCLTFSRCHIAQRPSTSQIPERVQNDWASSFPYNCGPAVFPVMMGAPIKCSSIAEACRSARSSISTDNSSSISSLSSSAASQSAAGMPAGVQHTNSRMLLLSLSDDEGQTMAQQPSLVGAAAAIQQMQQRQKHKQKQHLHSQPAQAMLACSAPQ